MKELDFFENKYDKLIEGIPKLISGISYNSDSYLGFSVLGPLKERHINQALGKELPSEFRNFYKKIGRLKFENKMEGIVACIENAQVMMDCKYAPLYNIDEEYIKKKKYLKSPFWKVFFFDLHIDNLNLADSDSISKLDQLRRLKLVLTHSTNLYHVTVDFFDASKEYQLYHFERGDIYPIDLTFSQFVEGFMYLGDTLLWWTNFMKPENRVGRNYPTWDEIEKGVKGFKREMLLKSFCS